MKKLFLLLLLLLPMSSMAQEDWTEGYKGETNSKGEPHGKGVMVWKQNNGTLCRFDGYFSNGKPGDGSHTGIFFKKKGGKIIHRGTGFIYRSRKDKKSIFIMQTAGRGASIHEDEDPDMDDIIIGEVRNDEWYSGTQIFTLDYQARSFSNGMFGRLRTHLMDRSERMEYAKYLPQLYSKEEIKSILKKGYWQNLPYDEYKDCVKQILKYSPTGTTALDFQNVQSGEGYVIYNSKLVYLKNINWTSEIKGGKINGEGEGIFQIDNVSCRVRGQYVDGVPREVEYLIGDGEWEKKNEGYSYYKCLSPTDGLLAYRDKTANYGFMTLDGRRNFGHYSEFKNRFSNGEAEVYARRNNFLDDVERSGLYSQDVMTAIQRKITDKYDYRTEFSYRVDTLGNFLGMTSNSTTILPPTQKEYLKLCAELDAYKNKLKAANTNYKSFKIKDNIARSFIDYFDYPGFDPKGKTTLARQIENEHVIINALQGSYSKYESALELAKKPSPLGMTALHNTAKQLLPAMIKKYEEQIKKLIEQLRTVSVKDGIDANSSYVPEYETLQWGVDPGEDGFFKVAHIKYKVRLDTKVRVYRFRMVEDDDYTYEVHFYKWGDWIEIGKYNNEKDAVAAGYYGAKYLLRRTKGEL